MLGGGDAEAAVADDEADTTVRRLQLELDEAAVRGVLDGVLDEVDEHLPQSVRIGGDLRAGLGHGQGELDARRKVRLRGGEHARAQARRRPFG